MASENKALTLVCLVSRLVSVMFLAASIYLMATDTVFFSFGGKTSFNDLIGYRYVLATSSIGLFYAVVQTPFSFYLVYKKKMTDASRKIIEFSMYADKMMGFLLATGVGAGFAVSIDTKRLFNDFSDDDADAAAHEVLSKLDHYFKKGNFVTAMLFMAFLCIAINSILYTVIRIREIRAALFG